MLRICAYILDTEGSAEARFTKIINTSFIKGPSSVKGRHYIPGIFPSVLDSEGSHGISLKTN